MAVLPRPPAPPSPDVPDVDIPSPPGAPRIGRPGGVSRLRSHPGYHHPAPAPRIPPAPHAPGNPANRPAGPPAPVQPRPVAPAPQQPVPARTPQNPTLAEQLGHTGETADEGMHTPGRLQRFQGMLQQRRPRGTRTPAQQAARQHAAQQAHTAAQAAPRPAPAPAPAMTPEQEEAEYDRISAIEARGGLPSADEDAFMSRYYRTHKAPGDDPARHAAQSAILAQQHRDRADFSERMARRVERGEV